METGPAISDIVEKYVSTDQQAKKSLSLIPLIDAADLILSLADLRISTNLASLISLPRTSFTVTLMSSSREEEEGVDNGVTLL